MPEVKSSILIDANVETVFSLVDDWEHLRRIHPRLRVEPREDVPTRGLGATFHSRVQLTPVPFVATFAGDLHVIDHYFPERIVFRGAHEGVSLVWTFGRVGERSLVELRQVFELSGGPVGRLVGNGIAVLTQRDVEAALRNLKRFAEAATG